MPDKKAPRYPRVEREEAPLLEEDANAHLWAISYSDFLMAILSFFILFYSADSSKRKTFIMNLSKELSSHPASADSGNGNSAGAEEKRADRPKRMPASISEGLASLDLQVEKEDEVLVLNFSDNFFPPGEFRLQADKAEEVRHVLEKLKPYAQAMDLHFEGHADDRPVRVHKNSLLKDNFVLSSLRASSALLLAKQAGYSDKHLFINAASSNIRNSRSLSIRVEPKDNQL